MDILHRMYPNHPMHQAFGDDPFKMLVAVVLSQRATDAMTIPTASALFARAATPKAMLTLSDAEMEQAIRKIGFYRQKTKALKKLCAVLLDKWNGEVPSTEEGLLSLPQVGRKTANIILTLFFRTPQIAVDIHVHRITHRLGWVDTKTPEETERVLTKRIPKKYIPMTNQVFVRHGQEICRPTSPLCSKCPIERYCPKVGVGRHR